MRIAVGQLWQETNTFNRNPTTLDHFENWGVATGNAVLEQYGETGELGGFLTACRESNPNIEFVGLARYACWPWGSVDHETWTHIRRTFREQLERAGTVDAVFLALHGAMAAEGEDDLTGALLEMVRKQVGPQVPVVGTLDLHANITPRMIEQAAVLAGYHACPHLDSVETGARAAAGLRRILEDDIRPVTWWRKLPMITPAESHNTFTGPPAELYRELERLEADTEILTAGLYMAMPWFDCRELGWTITLTAAEGTSRCKRIVDDLAAKCWDLRAPMSDIQRYEANEVVERALAEGGHPILIGDGADATNSGAPGDSTHLLRAFLETDEIPHGALTFLVDPDAVSLATQMGVGGTFDTLVGGAFAPEYSEPVRFHGTVERLVNLEFVLDGHISRNLPIHMGRGAVVCSPNVTVLFCERTGPGSTPRLYETAGLDPREYGIVVAKSPAGFRADYESIAAGILLADCPGCATPNWSRLNFLHANRPLWPLDKMESPTEARWCRPVRRT